LKRIITIFVFIVAFHEIAAQSDIYRTNDFILGVNGGMVIGGPIPTKSDPDFSGSLNIGPLVGIYTDYRAGKNINIQSALNISIKGLSITGYYKKDTLVEVNMGGQVGMIPTFYTADINGKMNLYYLDLPFFFTYWISGKATMFAGVQASMLVGGEYYTDVHVVVGEGGFYDDVNKRIDMYPDIRRFDLSLCLGGGYKIFSDLTFKLYGTRSFIPFNKPGTGDPSKTGNLYNTYFITSLVYDF
jgi:hypothetical protein